MRAVVRVWGAAARRLAAHLPRVIAVNLLWALLAWPLVTLGAATLAAYAWGRRAVLEREEGAADPSAPAPPDEPLRTLVTDDLRRLWWPGTLWALGSLLFWALWAANLSFWSARLGALGDAALAVALGYAAWAWTAAQPFLLDALAEGLPYARAVGEALAIVAAHPLYAHLGAVPPALLLALAWRMQTLPLVFAVAALLLYWAHVATGDPRPPRRPDVRDLL